eukprot:1195473-Prorocentrum_minimum.AAC.3
MYVFVAVMYICLADPRLGTHVREAEAVTLTWRSVLALPIFAVVYCAQFQASGLLALRVRNIPFEYSPLPPPPVFAVVYCAQFQASRRLSALRIRNISLEFSPPRSPVSPPGVYAVVYSARFHARAAEP